MRGFIPDYDGKHRIAIMANHEETKKSSQNRELSHFSIENDLLTFLPEMVSFELPESVASSIRMAQDFDGFEFDEDGHYYRFLDISSQDKTLVVTNQCNCNCVICPVPESVRKTKSGYSAETLIDIARCFPTDTAHITITGGEPFLLKTELFDTLSFFKTSLADTEYLLLTNGRAFSIPEYAQKMSDSSPSNMLIGIPLHGASANTHDSIMRCPGSFSQTMSGIINLLNAGLKVEIRIVVNKLNMLEMDKMARLIIDHFPSVSCVKIMAMEMTGNAAVNKEMVWVSYHEAFRSAKRAIDDLVMNGIDVGLYNFPLCCVDRHYWCICEKSISDYKIRYGEECTACFLKDVCGGVFAGTMRLVKNELQPISDGV